MRINEQHESRNGFCRLLDYDERMAQLFDVESLRGVVEPIGGDRVNTAWVVDERTIRMAILKQV